MMRGFQLWPQNLNRVIFDPLFGQKRYKKCQMSDFDDFGTFSTVFSQKEGQILSDLIFEAGVGILII